MISFLAITGLVNFISCFVFGFYVIVKNPKGSLNRFYFITNLSIALYSFGYFFWQMADNAPSAEKWFIVLICGVILINSAFLHFIFTLLEKLEERKIELILYHIANVFFIILNIKSAFFSGFEQRYDLGFWPVPTRLFHIYLAFWAWQCIYGFTTLLINIRSKSGIRKEQIKFLTLAAIIGFIGGASNWPMWYGIHLPPYPNILISLYVGIIAYAIIRYRFMDIKIVLSRAVIFIIVYSFVLGIPFLVGFHSNFGFWSFFLLFIFSTSGPLLFRFLQIRADNVILYREKYYQRFLRESTRNILKEKNLEKLLNFIVKILYTSVNVTFSALYLYNREKNIYYLAASEGISESAITSFKPDESFINKLYERKRPLTAEKFNNLFIGKNRLSELIIPVFSDELVICFIILGEKTNNLYYTKHDVNTFEIFSNQISLAIDNCIFMENNKKNREREFQAEKLAFIGGMAEGVAHRIKNRLNHFSLAAAGIKLELDALKKTDDPLINNNEKLKKTLTSLKEIEETLIDNVIRTDQVIQGIINYAHAEETENFFSKIFFDEIIRGAKDLTRIKHDIDKFPLEVNINSSNIIYGIKPQLIESVYNLLDNSLEAIDEKIKYFLKEKIDDTYIPKIEIKLYHDDHNHLIEITDNGMGIKDDDKNKIFAPYYTTKSSFKSKAFSGFGLFIVKRMIEENHRGKLWFESQFLTGTSFFIQLPKYAVAGDNLFLGQ
ncbi:MAG TPA: ATP-binding protein [Spirochaetota bacterium]|nr:ATP-binding protein [Spirochaetota bacterium]HPI88084.1 ATP-binding protein [Spirochaetota bacterium]HPR46431.1 ATP-binding protein [Spirochaetota bacterium]